VNEIVKILQVCRQFYPSVGGLETVTLGLGKSLRASGQECDVATLRRNFQSGESSEPFSLVEGLPVYRLRHFGSNRYPIAPEILKLVNKYDVLHIHAVDFFVDFLSYSRCYHKKPILLTTHGGIFHTTWFEQLKRLWFRTVTRSSLAGVRWVVGDSQHDIDLFRSIVPSEKLCHIPNGVDINDLLAQPRQIEQGLLVGIGRQAVNKRIEWIIRSVSELKVEFPAIRLVWIGPGSEQQRLNELAASLGVSDRVNILGPISAKERDSWLSRAHIYVSAASYEAFGVSTIEALASGAVPVVSSVGIHPEVVQTGINGWLWSGDNRSLTEILGLALRTNMARLEEMGVLSRNQAQRFSWDSIAKEYIDLYENMKSQ
jgi:alpha-1,3-mannosyltransferase